MTYDKRIEAADSLLAEHYNMGDGATEQEALEELMTDIVFWAEANSTEVTLSEAMDVADRRLFDEEEGD